MSILCSIVGASFVTAVAEVIRLKKGITAVGNAQVDTAQSKFGGASALFDGSGDYLRTVSSLDIGTNNFTFECWARTGTAGKVIFDNRSSDQPSVFIVNGSGRIEYYDPTLGTASGSTTTITNSSWNHLAWVRNGSSFKMFVNGNEEYTTNSFSSNLGTSRNLWIGSSYVQTDQYNGHLDEIRISNTARYTANFTAPTAPFQNDANTLLLIHCDGTDASTFFEDDNGVRSKKGITAIGNAQVDTAQSKFGGSSALFDGTDDYLLVSPSSDFVLGTNDWTAEMWIRPSSNQMGILIDTRFVSGDGSGNGICLYYDGTKLIYYTGGASRINGNAYILNTWQHIALVRNGNDHKMYVNGTQVGSTYNATNSITSVNTSHITIGTNSNAVGQIEYAGHMDEIRVSNIARYTSNFTAPTAPFVNDANTVLLIHADGTDASTFFEDDNGARSQKGIQAIGNAQVDTAQSKFGGASALFDGTGDYLSVSPSSDFQFTSTSSWTIECWVRTTAVNNQAHIIGYYNTSSPFQGYGFRVNDVNSCLSFWDGSAWRQFNSSSLAVNTWYHAAVVSDGGSCKLYLNGTQQTTTFTATSSINYNASNFIVGARLDGGASFTGHIDELRISNTARYTAGFTPSTTPFQNDDNTLLLLHMDGTDASTVFIDDNGVTPNYDYD